MTVLLQLFKKPEQHLAQFQTHGPQPAQAGIAGERLCSRQRVWRRLCGGWLGGEVVVVVVEDAGKAGVEDLEKIKLPTNLPLLSGAQRLPRIFCTAQLATPCPQLGQPAAPVMFFHYSSFLFFCCLQAFLLFANWSCFKFNQVFCCSLRFG